MKSNNYYFISPQEITVDNKTLLVDGKYFPIKNTESISLLGVYSINSQFISLLNKENIILHLYDYYENNIGSYYPEKKKYNNKVVLKQYEEYTLNQENQKFEKIISKEYVKLMSSMLKYYDRRAYINLNENELSELVKLKDVKKFIDEALIKKFYYEYFSSMVNKNGFNFVNREYRLEILNPINSLLSFYYALLYKDIINSIYKHGLDPRISFIHSINNRSSKHYNMIFQII